MRVLHVASGKYSEALVSLLHREELTEEVKTRFNFDWEREAAYRTYKITIVNDDCIMGLMSTLIIAKEYRVEIRLLESAQENVGRNKIYDRVAGCLIATACQLSFENRYDGFVSLVPKTELISHYTEKYHFYRMGGHLVIEGAVARNLIIEYLEND